MLPKRLPKPKRREGVIRSPGHLKFVRSHACCVPHCVVSEIEAAHVRVGTDGATSLKPGDNWAISLCRWHHAEQHRRGELAFERDHKINMKALAQEFWQASPHGAKKRRAA